MFEKSLYDLIRGLRNHKGSEREYIQHSLRECRAEIRGPDMDLKATALLKLIYLEMFGHDMSWASFNVLEVMSSQKYLQKRVGYLGAVQSFRTDTEVLMLATNLLKKDINSPSIPTISLPLITLPHIITPSLAMSLLSDLMPRLSHSNPSIRKKTIVALYRLALVYPETLRPAWPKIKEMLMSEEEDPSVTAAVINVVCELGWRRPRDFLPLAPRLFDLLIDGGNNWMAIKIIKLFATLTPLEPRLIKKLLPPLMTLIQTTQAMSLLYECINGIIQGGILEGTAGAYEGEEVAAVCVAKLRGMIASEGDPNLKYVALLAFNKIVISHPHVVAIHQETILGCIDDPDVSIRLQALDLGSGMLNADNLISVVNRLMKQLRNAQPMHSHVIDEMHRTTDIEPAADSDGEDPEEVLRPAGLDQDDALPMPEEYRIALIHQILNMCSRDTYTNITDFEWYIQTLVELVRLIPLSVQSTIIDSSLSKLSESREQSGGEISRAIGAELRNVAVRVSAVREEVVLASNSLVTIEGRESLSSRLGTSGQGVLQYAAWIVGEYADNLISPNDTLNSLLLPTLQTLGSETTCAYLQAIPKVLIASFIHNKSNWNMDIQTMTSLLLARIVYFLEPFATHPNLEVQERSVELLELMRLATEALKSYEQENAIGPLLLTRAIPALFTGMELNPVAATAQRKVPIPMGLDLEIPINSHLSSVLRCVEQDVSADPESKETEQLYYQQPTKKETSDPIPNLQSNYDSGSTSYQNNEDASIISPNTIGKRRQRQDRNQDDPFYIANPDESSSGATTPFHDIIKRSNGHSVDIDSIPIMDLDLGDEFHRKAFLHSEKSRRKKKPRQEIHVTADENINYGDRGAEQGLLEPKVTAQGKDGANSGKSKKSLLEVDSSGIGNFNLDESAGSVYIGNPGKETEDAEMAQALAEVERLRLEMQRASERISVAGDIPMDGTLVKKKKKKQKASKRAALKEDSKDGVDARAIYPPDADASGTRRKKDITIK